MFNDVDETVKQYFTAEIPISNGEIDVVFDRPTREWSGRLSGPTLNCFLYDIRERQGFRDNTEQVTYTDKGAVLKQRRPRRVDLSYMVTAWTREPEDEHRILGRALAAMYRWGEIDRKHFQGVLVNTELTVYVRVLPSDHVTKPADMWGVLDNEIRTSLVWVVTAPLDVFAPIEGPLVTTRELRIGQSHEEQRETSILIAGVARKSGDPETALSGVRVSVVGTAYSAVTGDDGRFGFPGIPAGDHVLKFEGGDGKAGEKAIQVPGSNYDIEL